MNILEILKSKLLDLGFGNKDDQIFYIAGSQNLPEPLSPEEESKALEQLSKNEIAGRQTLVEHNLRLVVYIAKKFENTGIGIEDLISIGTIGLMKAINTFNTDKNIKLATYASRCIENEILMYLRKTYRSRQEVSLDEVLSVDNEGNEMVLADVIESNEELMIDKIGKEEEEKRLYLAIEKLKPREKEIIILRYGLYDQPEMTQKEVADMLGISQSYISRLEKRIIDKIRHEMESKVKAS